VAVTTSKGRRDGHACERGPSVVPSTLSGVTSTLVARPSHDSHPPTPSDLLTVLFLHLSFSGPRATLADVTRVAGLLVVALAGCGGASAQASAPTALPSASLAASLPESSAAAVASVEVPVGPRRVALRFELNGRAFPLPLVHGTVAGEPIWMLVDTGANSHVIASWVARKAGMSMHALGDVGSDHTGRAVSAYTVEHPAMTIDGWGPLAGGPMLVTDVPEPIARIGIGAFVSPQWLASAGDAVVLDLVNREMRTAPWEDAVRALEQAPGHDVAPAGARLCEDTASAIKGLAFVLPASIDGHGVDLLLDTGAHRTDLLTTSKAGKVLAGRARPSREQMYAASGLVKTSLVRAAAVKIGDWTLTTDIDLVPGVADPVCPRDGVVSMDALASCTLLLGRKQLRGRCGP
jgi:predicted aspartyl protease